jgi:hypothetical protein
MTTLAEGGLIAIGVIDATPIEAPSMRIAGASTFAGGGTTYQRGERDTRYKHVPSGLLITGSPVQASIVGDALRLNDEVLATTPFEFEFPENTITTNQFNSVPNERFFLFFPDSAKKLIITFEMKVQPWAVGSVPETGEVKVEALNGVFSGEYRYTASPWEVFFGGGGGETEPVRGTQPSVSQTVSTTNTNWTEKTVELDLTGLSKSLDQIEGVFSGVTQNAQNTFPDHANWTSYLTHITFKMRNLSDRQVSIRKLRSTTSRFTTAETRGPTNLIVQPYIDDTDPQRNPRVLQSPDVGFLQVDMVEQNIVAGQPVSPLLMSGLVQNDRSQAALLNIGPIRVEAGTTGNWITSSAFEFYLPEWAGRVYLFAHLKGTNDGYASAGVTAEYSSTLNGTESVIKRVTSRGTDLVANSVFQWDRTNPALLWTRHLEALVVPLRGTVVSCTWKLQHEQGSILQKQLDVTPVSLGLGLPPLPINCVILPPQTDR